MTYYSYNYSGTLGAGLVITRSRLQPINTLINTFFSKLRAFLVEQRGRKKANDGER